VNLDTATLAILRDRRKRQTEERLAAGPVWSESGFVFTRLDGRPLNPRRVSSRFSELAQAAGVRGLTFHALRHAAISYLLDAGYPLIVVAARAGQDPVVTARTYGHPQEAREIEAGNAAGGILERG
jgi:integrase